jgi:hypothetical protein
MSARTPAGEKGTADRIEADDGGFWVRLVSKQALRREGVCMDNCLDSQGHGQHTAGDEDMVSDGFWSLRKADGLRHMLVQVHAQRPYASIGNVAGPKNNQPSGWCCRQLRHLVAAFSEAGATLRVPKSIALTDKDGRTWRPDKAPQALRAAVEPRRARPREPGVHEFAFGRVICRPAGSNGAFVELGSVGGSLRVELPGPPPPGSELRLMQSAVERGLVVRAAAHQDFATGGIIERMLVRLVGTHQHPPRQEQVLTRNDDGTFDFSQTGPGVERVFPGVRLERREERIEGEMRTLELTISKRHRFGGPVYARSVRDPDGYYRTRYGPDDVESVELSGRLSSTSPHRPAVTRNRKGPSIAAGAPRDDQMSSGRSRPSMASTAASSSSSQTETSAARSPSCQRSDICSKLPRCSS